MTTETTTTTILNVNEVHEVASYPYGRLRTKAMFSVEFVKGKGFRNIFQTINPKTGVSNAPKKSTYGSFFYQKIDQDGKITNHGYSDVYSDENINRISNFIFDNQDNLQLTDDMIKSIAQDMLLTIRAGLHWAEGNIEEVKKVYAEAIKTLVTIINTGNYLFFSDIFINIARLEEIKINALDSEKIKFVAKTYELNDTCNLVLTKEEILTVSGIIAPAVVVEEIKPVISFSNSYPAQLRIDSTQELIKKPAYQMSMF